VLSLDSGEKKNGGRLDRFHVIICIIATQLQLQFINFYLFYLFILYSSSIDPLEGQRPIGCGSSQGTLNSYQKYY